MVDVLRSGALHSNHGLRDAALFGPREHLMGLRTSIPIQSWFSEARRSDCLEQFADFLGDTAGFEMDQACVRTHRSNHGEHCLGTSRIDEQNTVISSDTHF